MNGTRLFELMDNIDDKYIADAKIKPKAHVIEVSESGPWAFFKGAVSAAAVFLVLGAIFVWTLVGKDVLNAYHGKDTTNEMTTTNNVIVPPVADTTTFPIAATTPDGFTTQTPITTTAPITTTPPPVTDITTTVPITTTQPPVTTTTPVTTPSDPLTMSGEQLMEIINEKAKSDEKIKGIERELTADEIAKVKAFLEKDEARWFIPNHSDYNYLRAEDIDPIVILRASYPKQISDAEVQALKKIMPFYAGLWDTDKLTTSEIKALLAEYMNVSFSSEMKSKLLAQNSDFDIPSYYVEQFDAYYRQTTEDTAFYVGACKGYLTKDGSYLILVCEAYTSTPAKTLLVLNPIGDAFYFDKAVVCSSVATNSPTTDKGTGIWNYDAQQVIEAMEDAGCPEDKLVNGVKRELSEKELNSVKEFIFDGKSHRVFSTISHYTFFDVEEITPYEIIHSGSATYRESDEEWEAYCLKVYGVIRDDDFRFDFNRMTTAELKDYYRTYLGIEFDPNKEFDNSPVYLEEFDAYYICGGGYSGTHPFDVKGWVTDSGNYLLVVSESENYARLAVVIKPVEKGYNYVMCINVNN